MAEEKEEQKTEGTIKPKGDGLGGTKKDSEGNPEYEVDTKTTTTKKTEEKS